MVHPSIHQGGWNEICCLTNSPFPYSWIFKYSTSKALLCWGCQYPLFKCIVKPCQRFYLNYFVAVMHINAVLTGKSSKYLTFHTETTKSGFFKVASQCLAPRADWGHPPRADWGHVFCLSFLHLVRYFNGTVQHWKEMLSSLFRIVQMLWIAPSYTPVVEIWKYRAPTQRWN